VFLDELGRGNLPNYQSVVQRGLFFPSAVVGGHFQRTSNLSEITGRPFTSEVHPRENILNAAARAGAVVGVVNDHVITLGAQLLQARGQIASIEEVYPTLIERPRLENLGLPKIEFLPDLDPPRWLYWYRERCTHRHFYNFALAFQHEGGLLEEVVNDNPGFVKDQQRYSLRLQDAWFGSTLRHLEARGVLEDTIILVFSSHGTSIEGWLPLMNRATRANVDHAASNFHPNVSRSFAILAGPGIPPGRRAEWISIMDLKPSLCRFLGIEDLGGSAYECDLLRDALPPARILADVTSKDYYSLFHTASEWLLMSVPRDKDATAPHIHGLPTSPDGLLAFQLTDDPTCSTPRTAEFLRAPERARLVEEARRLQLSVRPALAASGA
jgi:hypothetical protein